MTERLSLWKIFRGIQSPFQPLVESDLPPAEISHRRQRLESQRQTIENDIPFVLAPIFTCIFILLGSNKIEYTLFAGFLGIIGGRIISEHMADLLIAPSASIAAKSG